MFAEECGLKLVEVNLEKSWQFVSQLKKRDPRSIVQALSFELEVEIDPAKSLLFFDEIQAEPDILPILRYFYEEAKEYAVIATGSLLEFVLAEPQFSMPVGRIELYHMGPLTFEEFLHALGRKQALAWLQEVALHEEVPDHVHSVLSRDVRLFTIVGGMPESVSLFAESQDLVKVEKCKTSIIETIRLDFHKYVPRSNPRLLTTIFDSLPAMIGRKVIYSRLDSSHKSQTVSAALQQLCLARVVSKVFNSAANGVPLAAERNERFFKPLMLDTGLLVSQLQLNPVSIEDDAELDLVNNGVLAEQMIGQELYQQSPRYQSPQLHYWAREQRSASAEVDYLVTDTNQSIIPVEVKAGSSGSLRSLHMMIAEKGLKKAIRFNSEKPSVLQEKRDSVKGPIEYTLISLPHYLVQQVARLLEDTE